MKNLNTFLLLVIIAILAFNFYPQENTDLEIYTDRDIYYITGLRILSESGEIDKEFANRQELKKFVIQQTARDIEY